MSHASLDGMALPIMDITLAPGRDLQVALAELSLLAVQDRVSGVDGGILAITATPEVIWASVSDGRLGLRMRLNGQVAVPGSLSLEAKLVAGFAKSRPDDDIHIAMGPKKKPTMTGGSFVVSPPRLDDLAAPTIDWHLPIETSVSSHRSPISQGLQSTLHLVESEKDDFTMRGGLLIGLVPPHSFQVALTPYRLTQWGSIGETSLAVRPSRQTAQMLSRLLSVGSGDLSIESNERLIYWKAETWELVGPPRVERFPAYHRILESVMTDVVFQSISRLALQDVVATAQSIDDSVHLSSDGVALTIAARHATRGDGTGQVVFESPRSSVSWTTVVSAKHVLQALSVKALGSVIEIGFNPKRHALVFESTDPLLRQIIMGRTE